MKTLSQILGLALIASSLAACGSSNTTAAAALAAQQAAAYGTQTAAGGCVQLGAPLAFTANGASTNSTTILAGNFPASSGIGSYGTVTMGGGYNNGGSSIQYQPKVSSSGQLQVSVMGNIGATSVVSGVIQLQQNIVSQIQASMGGTYNTYNNGLNNGVNTNNMASVCVTSISLWAIQTVVSSGQNNGYPQQGYAAGSGVINQAVVYLTLNNGQQVGPIPFY